MEHKIGEIFEYNGEWYQCIKNDTCDCDCDYCDFGKLGDCDNIACSSGERSDYKEVYFKKFEKTGEPVTVKGRTFQKLILDNCSCANCVFNIQNKECYKNSYIDGLCPDDEIWVEIKQNKENMEKKKQKSRNIDIERSVAKDIRRNLKPFDLEAAKAGKPVCTRDERKARIIAFDANGGRPIVALVTECDNEEIPYKYHCDGSYNCQSISSDNDLMMFPEKKEGWAKVRKDINLYDTKEEADRKMIGNDEYVTAKVYWEE